MAMLAVVAVLVVLAIGALTLDTPALASLLVRPTVLFGLLAANLLVLAFRWFAVWDAWRAGERRSAAGIVLTMLLMVVAIPHVAVAYGQVRTYAFLTNVFGQEPVPPAADAGPATTAPPVITAPTLTTTTTVAPTTTTTTIPWAGQDRLNVLLLGGDGGPGREGVRTDSMILASVGLDEGDMALFGFPRNLGSLAFPDGTPFTAYDGILNEVYRYGGDNPGLFPGKDPGAEAIRAMIEGISGLDIDYYVLVNLEEFVELVDALGGVTMYVPRTLVDTSYPKEDGTTVEIRIEEGVQELDGTHALAYVRSRRQGTDYDRMTRQRCLLTALIDQASAPRLLRALPRLFSVIEESVTTDLPLAALPGVIELAGKVDATEALVVGFSPPEWITGRTPELFPIPDLDRIRSAIQLVITDPERARIELGLEHAGDECEFGDQPAATSG